ncbi:hypothetical protein QWY84_07990 [Aquisalimonas lutea]|uniref:hypothetical protein n=1 Tax=Aquisalimonas lutea TaxID=1327750 RepID=UPI0025B51CBC|nr:hypothetical protein [Aquisalimonas lutea]MDN3517545.1 hypothetical protein [Aquisalimonas lutea]
MDASNLGGAVLSDNELATPLPTEVRLVEINASGNPRRHMLGVYESGLSLTGNVYTGLIEGQDGDYFDRFGAVPFGPSGQYLIQVRKKETENYIYLIGILERNDVLNIYYIKSATRFRDRMSALGLPSTVTSRSELETAVLEAIESNYYQIWKRYRVFDMNGDRRAYADFRDCVLNCYR